MTVIGRSKITRSHRLLVALGVVSFLFWAVMTTLSTRDNITQVNELYDVHLAHTAKAFLQMMDPDHNEAFFPTTMSSAVIDQLFNSWPELPNRASIFKNPAAPPEVANSAPPSPATQSGSRRLRYQLWRDDGKLLFRSDNAPLALGLPVLLLLLWFSIRKGLHPLATLSQEITKRRPDNLTPIDARSVPDEV